MQDINLIDELDQNYYNGTSINSPIVNELINISNEYIDLYMGAIPLDTPKSKDHIKFFEENDNLSTNTEDIDSDLFSIDSNDSTVIFKIEEENTRSNFLHKLRNLLLR